MEAPAGDPPDIGPPPKWLSWIAWSIGAIALFSLLLGRVTMDAIDGELPQRDAVRTNANVGRPLAIEVADGADDSEEIRDALSVMPEMLALVAEQKQSRIIITTLEAIAERGVSTDQPMSHVGGYFTKNDWQIHIAGDASKPGMVALHEYGHLVDAALDTCSSSPAFTAIFEEAVAQGELGRHYASAPAEAFAYMFSQYFFSDRRRDRLASVYPNGSEFMSTLASTGACPDLRVLD